MCCAISRVLRTAWYRVLLVYLRATASREQSISISMRCLVVIKGVRKGWILRARRTSSYYKSHDPCGLEVPEPLDDNESVDGVVGTINYVSYSSYSTGRNDGTPYPDPVVSVDLGNLLGEAIRCQP